MLVALLAASGLALPIAVRAAPFPSVSTVAASGAFGIPGGTPANTPFMEPIATAVAPDGSVYVSDFAAQRVVQISRDAVRVVAGGGAMDASGIRVPGAFANGEALSARFDGPAGLAFDGDALLIADAKNHCIRQLKNAVVTTFAGVCGQSGYANGSGDAVRFILPLGLYVVPGGAVYVADAGTGLRKIDATGRVTAINISSYEAYAIAYEATTATMFVTTNDGIFVLRNDTPTGIKYGGIASNGVRASQLSYRYDAGYPFGIVALDRYTVLYSDAVTGALRYLEGYTGTAEVLSGSGTGGDFRLTGRENGPLGRRSFVQPLGLALSPDHAIIVADGLGRLVRRIAPWSAQTLAIPADESIPHWAPNRFRIAYIGNSTIWAGATWYDSIEGQLQAALDKPAFRAAHGVPEVLPFWIVGANEFGAAADYGTFLVKNHLADAIVLQQSSMSLFDPSPAPPEFCGALDFGKAWSSSEASTLRLADAASHESVPLIGVIAPDAADVSPAESLWWSIAPGQMEQCDSGLVDQKRQFHRMVLMLFARARIATADLWPTFIGAEGRPDSRPLFGSFDGHFTLEGRALAARTVLPVVVKVIDGHSK